MARIHISFDASQYVDEHDVTEEQAAEQLGYDFCAALEGQGLEQRFSVLAGPEHHLGTSFNRGVATYNATSTSIMNRNWDRG